MASFMVARFEDEIEVRLVFEWTREWYEESRRVEWNAVCTSFVAFPWCLK